MSYIIYKTHIYIYNIKFYKLIIYLIFNIFYINIQFPKDK